MKAASRDDDGVAIGRKATVTGEFGMAMGFRAKSGAYSMALGRETVAGTQAMAIGSYAQAAKDDSTAIGFCSKAGEQVALAVGSFANASAMHSSTFGFKATADETAWNGLALGREAKVGKAPATSRATAAPSAEYDPAEDDNTPEPGKEAKNSIAIGNSARALGFQNTAVGAGATALDSNTLAVGLVATAKGNYASAFGKQALAEGEEAMALGHWARSMGDASVALGDSTLVRGMDGTTPVNKAVAIGSHARAAADNSVALGSNSLAMIADDAATTSYLTDESFSKENGVVSVGNAEYQVGETTVAENRRRITNVAGGADDHDAVNVAQLKKLEGKVEDSALGFISINSHHGGNLKNDGATGMEAIAIGQHAKAGKMYDLAIGVESEAANRHGVAIGYKAVTKGDSGVAIGARSFIQDGGWSIAIGSDSKSKGFYAMAIGDSANAEAKQSMAIGLKSQAATETSMAMGVQSKALGDFAMSIGGEAEAKGNQSTVVGLKAHADETGVNGVALGRDTYIGTVIQPGSKPEAGVPGHSHDVVENDKVADDGKDTMNSVAVGYSAKAYGFQNTAVGAAAETYDSNSMAIGVAARAKGHYASALGKQAWAEGEEAVAIGHWARSVGESAVTLGDYSMVYALDGKTPVNKAVAIGSSARAASDNSVALGTNSLALVKDDVATKAYLTDEAFAKVNGVVSVGNAAYHVGGTNIDENRRRITNVAGGADDYDAVNVAQLKKLEAKVAGDVKDGKVDVQAGGNLTVTDEAAAGGGTVYTVALNKDIVLSDAGSLKFKDTLLNETGLTIAGGPVIQKTNVDMGDNIIHNVKAGVKGTDAVNVSQLEDLAGDVKGNKVDIDAGDNLAVSKAAGADGGTVYTVALNKDIVLSDAGSLKFKDTLLNETGLSIAGAR